MTSINLNSDEHADTLVGFAAAVLRDNDEMHRAASRMNLEQALAAWEACDRYQRELTMRYRELGELAIDGIEVYPVGGRQ